MQNNFNTNMFGDMMKNFDPTKFMDFMGRGSSMCNAGNCMNGIADLYEKANNQYNKFMQDLNKNNPFAQFFNNNNHVHKDASKMHDLFGKNAQMTHESMQEVGKKFQDIMKKKMEILQAHASDVYGITKQIFTSSNPEVAMSMQADFAKKHWENVINDYQKLSEMIASASMESFETMSKKFSDSLSHFQNTVNPANSEKANCDQHKNKDCKK